MMSHPRRAKDTYQSVSKACITHENHDNKCFMNGSNTYDETDLVHQQITVVKGLTQKSIITSDKIR